MLYNLLQLVKGGWKIKQKKFQGKKTQFHIHGTWMSPWIIGQYVVSAGQVTFSQILMLFMCYGVKPLTHGVWSAVDLSSDCCSWSEELDFSMIYYMLNILKRKKKKLPIKCYKPVNSELILSLMFSYPPHPLQLGGRYY